MNEAYTYHVWIPPRSVALLLLASIYFLPPLFFFVPYRMCVYDCGLVVRVHGYKCESVYKCMRVSSLSQDKQSHPSSVLSNGGSRWLTLGLLIRPHLVGILL